MFDRIIQFFRELFGQAPASPEIPVTIPVDPEVTSYPSGNTNTSSDDSVTGTTPITPTQSDVPSVSPVPVPPVAIVDTEPSIPDAGQVIPNSLKTGRPWMTE